MVFEKTYRNFDKKKEKPNRLRDRKVLSFKCNPESRAIMEGLGNINTRTEFINRALVMKNFYERDREQFMRSLIESDFGFVRHMVRKIGRERYDKIKKLQQQT